MKKILIHIGSLRAGGAEKSLVSFLNVLPSDLYEIDLMLLEPGGLFLPLVPKNVNIIEAPFPYRAVSVSILDWKYFIKRHPKYWFNKMVSHLPKKVNKDYSYYQNLWNNWKELIPNYTKKYDIAISYLEGITNYYVLDKVQANKKIIWIHNEYDKLKYNPVFDLNYFRKADAIVTISSLCRDNLLKNFPSLSNKLHILENITDSNFIKKMAFQPIDDSLFNIEDKCYKLLSVGRLDPQKNYSLALSAAAILKEKGFDFKWYIIGEGVQRKELESMIHNLCLDDFVFLLGLRSNPYSYMFNADIIVQTSLYEGKSIAIDEAKILCKPIVATSYPTIYDLIENGINGSISDMTPECVAHSIMTLFENPALRQKYIDNLTSLQYNNLSEVNKYVELLG